MHAVFLDASKAFDQVIHMKLFEKLIERKVLMCFVRLLKHWYKEQTMQVKWGEHFSEPFHVFNGVRQGGVLSPYLFAVYLDDLSKELNNIKAGCYIGKVKRWATATLLIALLPLPLFVKVNNGATASVTE